MNSADGLENRIKHLRLMTGGALDQRILADASAALASAHSISLDAPSPGVWRIIMSSKWTKLAAAVLFAVTVGIVTFHREWTTAAYALEDTIQANLGLRSLHIRVDSAGGDSWEIWAEFGDDGQLRRLRINAPKSDDGDKQIVWQDDKAEVWFKSKGSVLVLRDKQSFEKMAKELAEFDPKIIVQQLYDAQSKGKAKIETQKPSDDAKSITLVVSFTDSPDKQEIYRINAKTKLVQQLKKYHLVKGEFVLTDSIDFLEYNQEIAAATFVLDVPANVTRTDWTTQEVGLPKGTLSDKQIAVKVAREFFEALIAKNYARAGGIYSGTSESRMKDLFAKFDFVRIISVGDPTPNPDVSTHFLQVPSEVEFRVDGKTYTRKFTPNIRPVEGQPDRWLIGGGI